MLGNELMLTRDSTEFLDFKMGFICSMIAAKVKEICSQHLTDIPRQRGEYEVIYVMMRPKAE